MVYPPVFAKSTLPLVDFATHVSAFFGADFSCRTDLSGMEHFAETSVSSMTPLFWARYSKHR